MVLAWGASRVFVSGIFLMTTFETLCVNFLVVQCGVSDILCINVVSLIRRVSEKCVIKTVHKYFVGYLYNMDLITSQKREHIKIMKYMLEY